MEIELMQCIYLSARGNVLRQLHFGEVALADRLDEPVFSNVRFI